ncbi:50S ribosomal protein L3 N(5)-glutamine methyltransferase [Motiliproteus sp. SC1-56]|uniref:50S ribosomal protein L3 N(5)-glutamine methyltransferase n=1 Tax=Motiliproteus sp. SC1-56 TaxID=2799565 RepID=UPI001A8C5E6D|nr:50S ribosomal protein L3 N(5)-glutamine methyltransferase [Motiliproteus sp. SC1-56]
MTPKDPAFDELHSILDFIRLGAARFRRAGLFFGHGTDNAWDEAVQLVLHAAGLPWDADPQVMHARLLKSEKAEVLSLFQRRIEERLPAPYLTGEAWFCDLPFYVDAQVLVPRSPIAQLIRNGFEPWLLEVAVDSVLDLCTGSGCIGIACAKAFEDASVDLVDLSPEALSVAERNIERHRLQDRVRTHQGDLFTGLEGRRYQLIVSNPPYVDQQDFEAMPAEYRHEPVMGLISGEDGLDITRRILRQALDFLTPDGLLVVEVGNSEAALQAAYPEVPFIWVDLPEGGNGVFVLSAEDLARYQSQF